MSLIIDSATGDNLPRLIAEKIDIIILDIDDTLYNPSARYPGGREPGHGLHDIVKNRIVADARANGLRDILLATNKIAPEQEIKSEGLDKIFPLLVDYYRAQGAHTLNDYMRRIYDDIDYSIIPPHPESVAAMQAMYDVGIRFYLYTNGPYADLDGRPSHGMKVISRLGYPDDFFGERNTVDLLKTDRNPQIVDYYRKRNGITDPADIFRKGIPSSMSRMAETLKFELAHNVGFIDDSAHNLSAATYWGVQRIHTPTARNHFDDPAAKASRDYAVWSEPGENPHQFSNAGLLLVEAAKFLPQAAPAYASLRGGEVQRPGL